MAFIAAMVESAMPVFLAAGRYSGLSGKVKGGGYFRQHHQGTILTAARFGYLCLTAFARLLHPPRVCFPRRRSRLQVSQITLHSATPISLEPAACRFFIFREAI